MSSVFGADCDSALTPMLAGQKIGQRQAGLRYPSIVNWPGERTFAIENDVQCAKLPPNANWCAPRTSVRSSLNW